MKVLLEKDKLDDAKKLIDNFLEKDNLKRIKNISEKIGLNYNLHIHFEIVSSEVKYIFNYLSGAFGNTNLKKGADEIKKFLEGKAFSESVKHFSGRAIYDRAVVKKVSLSLSYLKDINLNFIPEIENLCSKLNNEFEKGKTIILIGVSKKEKIENFDRLLSHEIFHLVLFSNKIRFESIDKKYSNLDEGLAIFLSYLWEGNIKKVLELKKELDKKSAMFWYKELMFVPSGKETKKIKEVYDKLKNRR